MACVSGTNIVNDSLVISLDHNNYKNYIDKGGNNLYLGGSFPNGDDMPAEGGSNATNEIVILPNPGDTSYVLRQTGTQDNTEYQITLSGFSSSTTYVLSGWYAESPDYSGDSRMFHCRAYSTGGSHTSLGTGIGAQIGDPIVIDGVSWTFRYTTITTPSDATGVFDWYVGYAGTAYSGYRYYTNLRCEVGTFPTIRDFSGNNRYAVPVNGITYNNGYVLDGTNDYLTITRDWHHDEFTIESIVEFTSSNNCNLCFNVQGQGLYPRISKNGSNVIYAQYRIDNTTQSISSSTISLNTPYHILFKHHPSSGAELWINGSLDGTNSTTGNHDGGTGGSMYIGYDSNLSYYSYSKLSEFRLYSRALTTKEIKQNFNATRTRYGI